MRGTWCIPSANCAGLALLAGVLPLRAEDTNLVEEVRELRQENAVLKQQVQRQGSQLDTLTRKVNELEASGAERANTAAASRR